MAPGRFGLADGKPPVAGEGGRRTLGFIAVVREAGATGRTVRLPLASADPFPHPRGDSLPGGPVQQSSGLSGSTRGSARPETSRPSAASLLAAASGRRPQAGRRASGRARHRPGWRGIGTAACRAAGSRLDEAPSAWRGIGTAAGLTSILTRDDGRLRKGAVFSKIPYNGEERSWPNSDCGKCSRTTSTSARR